MITIFAIAFTVWLFIAFWAWAVCRAGAIADQHDEQIRRRAQQVMDILHKAEA